MIKGILMTTALLTVFGVSFTAHASKAQISQSALSDGDYETKWCRDAGAILRNSLSSAYNAASFEREVEILKKAINETVATLNPKFNYYFESTLSLGVTLEPLVDSAKDKSLLLRRNIENALDDLAQLDQFMSHDDQDHVPYAVKVLNRVTDEGYRSKTDQIEIMLLDAGSRSVIRILGDSDNRRSPNNACAVVYLKQALKNDDIHSKRAFLSDAIYSLRNECRHSY